MARHRFEMEKQQGSGRSLWIMTAVFLLITVLFVLGVSAVSNRTEADEAETLRKALQKDIIHCYALEGSYPESLEVLESRYGLSYDTERFFVDYQAMGSNIPPDVTIIDREAGK